MKWGVRRFQNADGSLTASGKRRYASDIREAKQRVRTAKKQAKEAQQAMNSGRVSSETRKKYVKAEERVDWEKEAFRREN